LVDNNYILLVDILYETWYKITMNEYIQQLLKQEARRFSILEEIKAGKSVREVAKKNGITRSRVYAILKQCGYKFKRLSDN
jgi:DNA-binding phage protein